VRDLGSWGLEAFGWGRSGIELFLFKCYLHAMNIKYKIVLIWPVVLLTSPAHSLVGEVLDRIYDFSERVVLVNSPNNFYFQHCKLNKCERITETLPRDLTMEEFVNHQKRLGLQTHPDGQQAMMDALSNYRRFPKKYEMVAFGKSIQPEKFDVFCSAPEITNLLKSSHSSENTNWHYRYRGEANKVCRALGQEETSQMSFSKYIQVVKATAEAYSSARQDAH
jgi:hypothetical protein